MREPKWRQEGEDPDYRFSLANERTFLAWIRTSLALLAGGVLLGQFSTRLGPHFVIIILATVLGILAAALSGIAYLRWRANERAMRNSRRLPGTLGVPLVAASLLCVSAAMVILLVTY